MAPEWDSALRFRQSSDAVTGRQEEKTYHLSPKVLFNKMWRKNWGSFGTAINMVLDQLIHSRQFTYELLQIQNFHNSDTVQMLYSIYYPEKSQFKTRNLCRWHSTAKIMSGQAKFAECKENQLEFNVSRVSQYKQ